MLGQQTPMELLSVLFAAEAAATRSQAYPAQRHQTYYHSSTGAAVMSKSLASAAMAVAAVMPRLLPALRLARLRALHSQRRVHHLAWAAARLHLAQPVRAAVLPPRDRSAQSRRPAQAHQALMVQRQHALSQH